MNIIITGGSSGLGKALVEACAASAGHQVLFTYCRHEDEAQALAGQYANVRAVQVDFTDEAFAQAKGFKGCVMYGNILNAFISHFVGMCLPTPHVMIQSQDINFHKPVFLNDEITLEAGIDTVSEAVNIINYKFKFYKTTDTGRQLVAKGHVQIGLLNK